MTHDAIGQAALVRHGAASPAALVEAAIAAIAELDPSVNAVVHRTFAAARAAADRIVPGRAAAPFAGVPLLVKDVLCQIAGEPYQLGMRLLRDRGWRARTDSYLAARFRRAGFLFLGRTNAPELATAFTTEPVAFGPTRNPWDPAFTAGGSSGGSAAAVACGMVAVAHGNDMGGSIRVPASACGVVGLKPTRGRTSLGPQFGDYWAMLAHEGVLTRTVRDTAAVLDAIVGAEPGDPCPAPPLDTPLLAAVEVGPPRLRIGVRTRIPVDAGPAHDECVAATDRVAAALEDAGHDVREVPVRALDDERLGGHFLDVFAVSVDRDLRRWEQVLGTHIGADDVEARNWTLAEHGRAVGAARYVESLEYLQAFARRVCTETAEVDILLTPTLPEPPPRLGYLGPAPSPGDVARLGEFTAPFNITGQPAISIPAHRTASGLPVGAQLVAGYGRDGLLLAVAGQVEDRLGWSRHHPGTSVWNDGGAGPLH
ncbi:MAG: amidase [Jatrophihabitans sp.]|nr:MAG: amidase [Jatrophihabitans sp.]